MDDAAAAAELSEQLGYAVQAETMKQRIEGLQGSNDHVVYVACLSQHVVGWVDVSISHHLQDEPRGEIGGLVVLSHYRNSGIGHQLVALAEQWVRNRGIAQILVRSRDTREAAHRFYRREGYTQTKTSAVFTKPLL